MTEKNDFKSSRSYISYEDERRMVVVDELN